MENQILLKYLNQSAPAFFLEEFLQIFQKWSPQTNTYSFVQFLSVFDSLALLAKSIPGAQKTACQIYSSILNSNTLQTIQTKTYKLKVQLFIELEMLLSGVFSTQKVASTARQLGLFLSFQGDSSDFYTFFSSDILVRFKKRLSHNQIQEMMGELEIDTEELEKEEIKLPCKRPIQIQNKKLTSFVLSQSNFRVPFPKRNFGSSFQKEIKVKPSRTLLEKTPQRNRHHISEQARRLQEINKKSFYKIDDEVVEVQREILACQTPEKEEEYLPAPEDTGFLFRNIFLV